MYQLSKIYIKEKKNKAYNFKGKREQNCCIVRFPTMRFYFHSLYFFLSVLKCPSQRFSFEYHQGCIITPIKWQLTDTIFIYSMDIVYNHATSLKLGLISWTWNNSSTIEWTCKPYVTKIQQLIYIPLIGTLLLKSNRSTHTVL